MSLSEEVTIQTENMSFGPAAVGRILANSGNHADAPVIFVRGAAPHEKVRARITHKSKTFWEAEVLEVIQPSVDRIQPHCKVFGICGGCQWQHLAYPAQVQQKTEILRYFFEEKLRFSEFKNSFTAHPALAEWGFRHRVQVHGKKEGLGFYAHHSRDLVPVDSCPVTSPGIQKRWSQWLQEQKHLEFLKTKSVQEFKVEWTEDEKGQIQEALDREHAAFGFSQVNLAQNQVLKKLVRDFFEKAAKEEFSKDSAVLIDLFGGAGNLSLDLKPRFRSILCVDSFNPGKPPSEFPLPFPTGFHLIRAKAQSFLQDQYWRDWFSKEYQFGLITDPPREGIGMGAVLDIAQKLKPLKWAMVSCDPKSLVQDLKPALNAGYKIEAIHLVDMFPHTFHIETVVLLKRILT